MAKIQVPTFDNLMNPLIEALKSLGGSGTIEEIFNKVIEIAGINDDQLEVLHKGKGKGYQTEVEYRLAWARTYLRKYGLVENSARGVWALTPTGSRVSHVDEKEVLRAVRSQFKTAHEAEEELEEPTIVSGWREQLLDALLSMSPSAFERLTQRLLRESGFTQVEITGRSGDGGIDGKGIMRLGGLLSFHVIFQCKRWQGSITPSIVRDFRGAMVGRADKGLFITTGSFTKDAVKEATRDGAPPIDLVDSDQLIDKLKELALGVKTRKIEKEEVTIDREWFASI